MPGSNRAVFLDRDGTIVEDPGYLTSPDQLKLLAGAAEAIGKLRRAGFLVILATNQSGIARGMMTEQDLAAIQDRLAELLAEADHDAKFDGFYFCPFHPDAKVSAYKQESYLRKPRPGMLFKAAREHQLDLGSCWMVGDSERDVQAGKTAGCRAIRVDHDPETETMADRVLPSLADAAAMILATPGRTPLRSARPGEPAAAAAAASVAAAQSPPVENAAPGEVAAEQQAGQAEQSAEAGQPPEQPGGPDQPEGIEELAEEASQVGPPVPGPAEDTGGQAASATQASGQAASATQATEHIGATAPEVSRAVPGPGVPDTGGEGSQAASATQNAGEQTAAAPTRTVGGTKERLLREIEESRKRVLAGLEKQADAVAADKTGQPAQAGQAEPGGQGAQAGQARPLNTGDVRHVLAEILQQLRQLNRGPDRHAISATKIIGVSCQVLSWFPLIVAAVTAINEPNNPQRAILWATVGVFLQLASLFWFMVFKQE